MSITLPEERAGQCVECGEFKTDVDHFDVCFSCRQYKETEKKVEAEKAEHEKQERLAAESVRRKERREATRRQELKDVADQRTQGLRPKQRAGRT